MTVVSTVAILITCLVVISVTIFLGIVAAKIGRLADHVKTKIDDEVTPWLTESRSLMTTLNHAALRAVGAADSIAKFLVAIEGGIGKLATPFAIGQHLARKSGGGSGLLSGLHRAINIIRDRRKESGK